MDHGRAIRSLLLTLFVLSATGALDWSESPPDREVAATPTWAKRIDNGWGGVRVHRGHADSQGGCVAAGDSGYSSNLDGWAIHFDKAGTILNQTTYSGKKNDRLASICASADTGYVAAGWTQFTGIGFLEKGGYGWLLKLGTDLNPIWAKAFSTSKTMNRFERIIKLNNAQGYLAIMVFEDKYYWYWAIVRLNPSGDIVWAYKLGDTGLSLDVGEVLQASDGSFYLTGTVSSTSLSANGFILKIDADGNPTWARMFGKGIPIDEHVVSAYLTGSGDLMAFGYSFDDLIGLVLKVDPNGNTRWQYLYKDPSGFATGLNFGMPGDGGGFFLAGSFNYNGVRTVFAKCNLTGGLLSKRSYLAFGGAPPNWSEYVSHAFRSSDGGVFLLSSDVMPQDVVISKLDSNGGLPKDCRLITFNVARSKSSYQLTDLSIRYERVTVTVKSSSVTAKSVSFESSDVCE